MILTTIYLHAFKALGCLLVLWFLNRVKQRCHCWRRTCQTGYRQEVWITSYEIVLLRPGLWIAPTNYWIYWLNDSYFRFYPYTHLLCKTVFIQYISLSHCCTVAPTLLKIKTLWYLRVVHYIISKYMSTSVFL